MRDIAQCHPKLQKLADELITACERKGLRIKITECFRTVSEQNALHAQGRTKPGKIVTNAKGTTFSSMHMWGVAFDICRNDGRDPYDDSDGFFSKVGHIGQALGLEWGGSWKSIVDKPHFQLPDWGSTASQLKAKYKTPDAFIKTWQVTGKSEKGGKTKKKGGIKVEDVPMKIIKKGSKGRTVCVWQTILGMKGEAVDGIFGDATEKKTKAFQKEYKLTADGIVGEKTWKAGIKSI